MKTCYDTVHNRMEFAINQCTGFYTCQKEFPYEKVKDLISSI